MKGYLSTFGLSMTPRHGFVPKITETLSLFNIRRYGKWSTEINDKNDDLPVEK